MWLVAIAFMLAVAAAEAEAKAKAKDYTLRDIDTARGIYDEQKNFLGEKGVYYDKDGNLATGVFKMSYPMGRLMFTAELANGKYNGEMRYYSWGGKLRSVSRYKDGKRDGETVLYDEDGNKKAEISYVGDVMHGAFKWYYPNGTLKGVRIMDNGKETEHFQVYNPDGSIKAQQ